MTEKLFTGTLSIKLNQKKVAPEKYVSVCLQSCYFGFVNKTKDLFLSDDHVWTYQNFNSHVSKHGEIFRLSNFLDFSDLSFTCMNVEMWNFLIVCKASLTSNS